MPGRRLRKKHPRGWARNVQLIDESTFDANPIPQWCSPCDVAGYSKDRKNEALSDVCQSVTRLLRQSHELDISKPRPLSAKIMTRNGVSKDMRQPMEVHDALDRRGSGRDAGESPDVFGKG